MCVVLAQKGTPELGRETQQNTEDVLSVSALIAHVFRYFLFRKVLIAVYATPSTAGMGKLCRRLHSLNGLPN